MSDEKQELLVTDSQTPPAGEKPQRGRPRKKRPEQQEASGILGPAILPLPKYVVKHRVETINRNRLAQTLDEYAVEGREIVALNLSRDIGGSYEIVSRVWVVPENEAKVG